jgi:hypothetical protein
LRIPQHASGSRCHSPVEPLAAVDVDLDAVALLDPAPRLVRLREEHARVEREDTRRRLDRQKHVDDHRRLLLERAGDVQARVELVHDVGENLLRAQRLQVRRGGTHGATG